MKSRMIAPDLKNEKYVQFAKELVEAASGEDSAKFTEKFMEFAGAIEQQCLSEFADMIQEANEHSDSTILAARGQYQLTKAEKEFYQAWIEAAKSENPKQALAELEVTLPVTVVNNVFDDLATEHPLLDAIDFQNVGAVSEWLTNANPNQLATWSPLCAEIVKELTSGFKKVNLTLDKLSAFIPVCKAMLDLGPVWLDRYVRTVLQEALYLGLEDGILNGRGQTDSIHEPIGMRKNLKGSVNQATGYPDKAPIEIAKFDPVSYGAILAELAQTEDGKSRIVTEVILVVSSIDYFKKVMPSTTMLLPDGTYKNNVLPFPTKIIPSIQLKEGEAIIGVGKRYFMGIGTGKSGKVDYSDDYRFLEDERVYLIKLYGHGQPKDNNSFMLLDISDLEPTILQVQVVESGDGIVEG